MTAPRYYLPNGRPTTAAGWLAVPEAERQVALDTCGDAQVSTYYIGIDHQYGIGLPLIFETMIFGGAWDDVCWRYSSREEAERRHRQLVADLRRGEDPRSQAAPMYAAPRRRFAEEDVP